MPPLQLRFGKWSGGWGVMVVHPLKGNMAIHLPGRSFVWMLDGSGWWNPGWKQWSTTPTRRVLANMLAPNTSVKLRLSIVNIMNIFHQLCSKCNAFIHAFLQLDQTMAPGFGWSYPLVWVLPVPGVILNLLEKLWPVSTKILPMLDQADFLQALNPLPWKSCAMGQWALKLTAFSQMRDLGMQLSIYSMGNTSNCQSIGRITFRVCKTHKSTGPNGFY